MVHTIPPVYITLLIGLYDFFSASDQSNGRLLDSQIGMLKEHGVNPGIARAGLKWLIEKDFVQQGSDGDQYEIFYYWELTPIGAEVVDDLISKRENSVSSPIISSEHIPANTFVDLKSYFASVDEVRETISKIATYVETNIEFELPANERSAVAAELRGLKAAVGHESVRAITLANALLQKGIFQFLKEKIPDKTIGALIGVVVGHIAKWLGW